MGPPIGDRSLRGQGGNNEGLVGAELADYKAMTEGIVLYTPESQRVAPLYHSIGVERDRACCTRLHWLVGRVPLNAHLTPGGPNATVVRDRSAGIAASL